MILEIQQGDVWDADFGGSAGIRPAVVVSRDLLNSGDLLLAVPCTGERVEQRTLHPNNVFLPAASGGLALGSAAQTQLIQPLRRARFRARRGKLSVDQLGTVLVGLAWTVDLFDHTPS